MSKYYLLQNKFKSGKNRKHTARCKNFFFTENIRLRKKRAAACSVDFYEFRLLDKLFIVWYYMSVLMNRPDRSACELSRPLSVGIFHGRGCRCKKLLAAFAAFIYRRTITMLTLLYTRLRDCRNTADGMRHSGVFSALYLHYTFHFLGGNGK